MLRLHNIVNTFFKFEEQLLCESENMRQMGDQVVHFMENDLILKDLFSESFRIVCSDWVESDHRACEIKLT